MINLKMKEFLVPNYVPNYLTNPEVVAPDSNAILKKYADGTEAWIELTDDGPDIETRFPDGSIYFDRGDEENPGPIYIEEGHEDPEPRNN